MSRNSLSSGQRKIRYRELISRIADLDDENGASAETVRCVSELVGESDILLSQAGEEEHARNPAEGFLDSQLLRETSNIVIRCSEAISGNVNTYDPDELAQHIRLNPDMWEFVLPRCVPTFAYLHGAFDPTPPQERAPIVRRRQERQRLADVRQPEDVVRLDKNEEGAEMMSRVNRFITRKHRDGGGRPLSYMHLVLDPSSFSRTIENVYYLSFLARDGLISVEIDEKSGLPSVTPVPPSQQEEDERSAIDEKQFIVSMDMPRWREYIRVFKIQQPLMVIKRG